VLFLGELTEFRRDATSSRLMRYRDQNGQDWADIIDLLTMDPGARRRVARILSPSADGWSGTRTPTSALDSLRLAPLRPRIFTASLKDRRPTAAKW
jgi:hypothetical protein